jgi:hypothetical protein
MMHNALHIVFYYILILGDVVFYYILILSDGLKK